MRRPIVVLVWLLLLAGCARNPVTGRPELVLTSAAREREIGAEEAARVEASVGLAGDPALRAYLEEVGGSLAAHSPRRDVQYRFHILDHPEPNAFALPGGQIYVSRGLLALVNSEDELAGVLGHEIGHVAARHAVQRATAAAPFALATGLAGFATGLVSPRLGESVVGLGRLTGGLVLAPYGRSQERDADRLGQALAARGGWDPNGLARFLETLERDLALRGVAEGGFLATHPSTPERVRDAVERARALEPAQRTAPATARVDFLQRLDGLVLGEDAARGVFRDDGRFLQPALDFALRFPEAWETHRAPDLAGARAPDGSALVLVEVAGRGNDPEAAGRALARDLPGLEERIEPTQIAGLRAARAHVPSGSTELHLTWIAHGGLVHALTGLCAGARRTACAEDYAAVAGSFHPLDARERAGIRQTRLRLRSARAGESLAALLERTHAAWDLERAALANGIDPRAPLPAGHLVKLAIDEPYALEGTAH